jgi:hypothetical protein
VKQSWAVPSGTFALESTFVPPNADRDARFHMEFFQNVLYVLLHGPRAAPKNFADLPVTLSGCDPFHHFELAFGQGSRLWGSETLCGKFR